MFDYERFSQLSKERGIKKTFLYHSVGEPDDYNSNLKKLKKVKPEYIETWAELLNTTTAYLNGETDDKEKPTDDNIGELLGMYDRLTDEEREQVIRKARELIEAHESSPE